MRGFEAMVKSGNPLALEAKRRAEVETDPAVQQQEYLPYLISVASEAQAAGEKSGALQAIQRFIQRVISAIKAWTVDKLGVPLKLSPDDVVALAERMVQRVAKSLVKNPSARANRSLNETSHSPFQKAIDDVVAGNTPLGYVRMGKTPDVLKMLGLPDVPVTINGATIEKVMAPHLGLPKGEHSNVHNLTPETLRQLPQQINNPVAVFKSGSAATKNGYVVLTELTEKDVKTGTNKPVIAALHVKTTSKGLELVNIGSVYGRSLKQMQNSIDDELLYWHKEKGQNFVNAFGLQLPSHMHLQKTDPSSKDQQVDTDGLQLPQVLHNDADLSKANIKTNEDLVKYQTVKADKPLFSRRAPGAFAQGIKAATVQISKTRPAISLRTGWVWACRCWDAAS